MKSFRAFIQIGNAASSTLEDIAGMLEETALKLRELDGRGVGIPEVHAEPLSGGIYDINGNGVGHWSAGDDHGLPR